MRTIKLKYKDYYLEDIIPGTNLYEISKLVQKDYKFPIIGAKLNNIDVDLSSIVMENGQVEFYDRSSSVGNRLYGRSLEFLIIVAAKRIFNKDTEVFINYSLDNGIYCEISGQRIIKEDVIKLEKEMKNLVKQQLQITKNKVSRLDAIKYFKSKKQLDKVKNLLCTINSTVDLHKMDNIYDYFFGPIVYDTSQIDLFKLNYLRQNSFVACYPSLDNPLIVRKYEHHVQLYKKYKEFETWGKLIDINTVSDLNRIGMEGKYGDAIRLFETHYESQLSIISEQIYKNRKNIKLVLLSGPSSSGKTTTTKKLSLYLKAKGLNTYSISLDDYFVDLKKTPKDENGNYDFANINAINIDLFNKHIDKLFKGEEIVLPKHDFISEKLILSDNRIKLKEGDILLIEGIHTLNDKLTRKIKRENKFKIFITPIVQLKIDNHNRIRTTDLRKLRRIVRDNRYRKTSAEETLKMWPNVDKEAKECIYPYQDDADALINSSLSYEIGVLRIFAEPLLYGIKSTSEIYPEAFRLINLLRQFMPISSESVPKDSMLREFIGEGVFN